MSKRFQVVGDDTDHTCWEGDAAEYAALRPFTCEECGAEFCNYDDTLGTTYVQTYESKEPNPPTSLEEQLAALQAKHERLIQAAQSLRMAQISYMEIRHQPGPERDIRGAYVAECAANLDATLADEPPTTDWRALYESLHAVASEVESRLNWSQEGHEKQALRAELARKPEGK